MKVFHIMARRSCACITLGAALFSASIAHAGDFYQQHNLVSDGSITADHTDANLVNSWGVAFNPFGAQWVNDNHAGVSTLYDGAGVPQSLIVQIPSPSDPNAGGSPTGIVFSGSPNGFVVSRNGISGPSRFIFATEDGIIAGWAPNLETPVATHAVKAVDNSPSGAIYKGLAMSAGGGGSLIYAADFHNNKIDVFDGTFAPVVLAPGAFRDSTIPAGFAPFGMQAINGNIYVSYAKQDADKVDDVKGKGFGFVDIYDPNGRLIRRLVSGGRLNAPWGMALAPAGFGKFSNRLLVGNFGDGIINAYDLATGRWIGRLKGPNHKPIQIDGLWGINFGNGFLSQPVNTLFFASGPANEEHGLYGRIDVATGNDADNDNDDPN